MLAQFLFSLQIGGKIKVRSIFSSTEARRRDQLVNFQVGDFKVQHKSLTRKKR